jgi:hypothetical protein
MSLRRPAAVVLVAASSVAVVPAAHAKAPHAADARQTSYVREPSRGSLDWGDVALGAGSTLLALVATASATGFTVRRRRGAGLAATQSA